MMQTGSCLCGGVAFTLNGPLRSAVACHCIQCRKTSGHYWSATSVKTEHMTLTASDSLLWFQSSQFARRGFCNVCGASVFYERDGTGNTAIAAGCLDDPTGIKEVAHIFTDTMGDYYDLPEGPAKSARWDDAAPNVPEALK